MGRGQAAEYFIDVRGYEGFADPVSIRLAQWSTQRFPNPRDAGSLPLGLSLPASTAPGSTAVVHLETAGAEPGIYFLQFEASGGGQTKTVDLALVIS